MITFKFIQAKVLSFFKSNEIDPTQYRFLLAVSGGIDSMTMLSIFHEMNLNIGIAHINHNMRGEASKMDETLVQYTAKELNLDFHLNSVSFENEIKLNKSIQEAARNLRYKWLESIREKGNYDFIATAHHSDDNVETIFYNFIKGTSIKGLKGIPDKNNKIIRPLLKMSKDEITQYAQANNIQFHEDASNQKSIYSRNLIRNEIIPSIEKINPSFLKTIGNHVEYYKSIAKSIEKDVDKFLKKHFSQNANLGWFNASLIQSEDLPFHIFFHFMQNFNFTSAQINSIWNNEVKNQGKQISSKTHILQYDREKYWIELINKDILLISNLISPSQFTFVTGKLSISKGLSAIESQTNLISIPKTFLAQLSIRSQQPGDKFHPIGMKGKTKKISDLFIDQKIPNPIKNKIPLLIFNNEIIWVIGQRLSIQAPLLNEEESVMLEWIPDEFISF